MNFAIKALLFLCMVALTACGSGRSGEVSIEPTNLSYSNPVNATVGVPLPPLRPTVVGPVTSYAVSPALPAGIGINSINGVISGVPSAAAATKNYVITASNVFGRTSFTLVLTVNATAPIAVSYASPQTYRVGTAIAVLAPVVTGVITAFAVAPALPPGLTLNATNGQISGTPTVAAGPAAYTITAINGSNSTTFSLTITVNSRSIVGWQSPELVSAPAQGAMGNARVGIDAYGNVIAVWRQDRTAEFDGYRVWSRRYVPGTGWGTIELLDGVLIGSGAIGELSLTVNPATGGAVAGWIKTLTGVTPPTVDIVARDFNPASGAWGSAVVIDTAQGETSGTSSFIPSLGQLDMATDPNDNVVAVWSQSPALTGRGRYSIWANRFSPSNGWIGAAEIEANNAIGIQDTNPKVAMLGNGDAVVAWVNNDGSRNSIWSNRYSAGTGWNTAAVLVNYQGTARIVAAPSIASDQAGSALVTWGQLDFSTATGAYMSNAWSKRFSGGNWSSTDVPVGSSIISNTMPKPRVKFGVPGIATVIWVDTVNSSRIYVNQNQSDGSWGIAQSANPAELLSLNELPDFGVDDMGNVTVVWVREPSTSSERGRVFGARLTSGAGWGTPVPLEDYDTFTTFVAQGPIIAMNARGNAMMVWGHVLSSAGGSQILARPFTSGR